MSEGKFLSETKRRRLLPYPKYKDSGIEWLGYIPEAWNVVRNLGLFEDRREKGFPDLPIFSVTQNDGVIPQEDVSIKIVRPSDNREGYKRIHPGDLVYNKMRMWQGAVGTAPSTAIVSPAYVVCKAKGEIDTRYFEFLYRTPIFITESGRYSYGICDDMNSLRFEDFKGIYSIVPPIAEQHVIATFLDRETAKIDALIEKKERLIELLQEKRTALITHAVTKGLDPNVPMKDSGIEWLGKIPKHWEVKRLKNLSSINDEALNEKTDPRFELIYVDIGGVDQFQGIIEREELVFENAPSRARRIVRDGDVIISTVRTYLRAIAPINKPKSNLIVSTGFAVIRPSSFLESNFAPYALRASHFIESVVANSVGVSYPAIDTSKMSCFLIATPNIEEQQEITSFLDRETAKIDSLVAKIHEAIDRLKEYRNTLISAVVTGKIDVREAQ